MPRKHSSLRRICWTLTSLAAAFAANASEDTVDAVWRQQRATFVYTGHTTSFTCHALERRLARVLRVIGAHEDMVFDRRDCNAYGGMRLHVTFRSPIEATEDNVRALTTYAAQDDLVARLRGTALPAAEDLTRFPATWQTVSFATDRRLRMTASDCELIEHVRRQLLPRMPVRVIEDHIICTPGSMSVRAPRLVIDALVASSD